MENFISESQKVDSGRSSLTVFAMVVSKLPSFGFPILDGIFAILDIIIFFLDHTTPSDLEIILDEFAVLTTRMRALSSKIDDLTQQIKWSEERIKLSDYEHDILDLVDTFTSVPKAFDPTSKMNKFKDQCQTKMDSVLSIYRVIDSENVFSRSLFDVALDYSENDRGFM